MTVSWKTTQYSNRPETALWSENQNRLHTVTQARHRAWEWESFCDHLDPRLPQSHVSQSMLGVGGEHALLAVLRVLSWLPRRGSTGTPLGKTDRKSIPQRTVNDQDPRGLLRMGSVWHSCFCVRAHASLGTKRRRTVSPLGPKTLVQGSPTHNRVYFT